jgi:drug/metabolite transporter (DMT)-like permease
MPSGRARGFAFALSATFFWSLAGLLIRLIGEATSWHIILYRSLGATALVGRARARPPRAHGRG